MDSRISYTQLWAFPSLQSNDPKVVKAFKFVFELVTKILVNWWALLLIRLGEKYRQNWLVKVVKQLPNAMSFFRIIAIPFVMFQLVSNIRADNHAAAGTWLIAMVAVIALDALDGPCARDLDAVSEFGSRLDPASDKICFVCIVLSYCLASWFEYSWEFCLVALGLAMWCLHVELKLIRLSVGPFRKLLNTLHQLDPEFADPGAHTTGKIKFCLQMLACVVGWAGLIFFPADPTAILVMAIVLFAARHFGDKSLGWHREEFNWLWMVTTICLGWRWHVEPAEIETEEDIFKPIPKPQDLPPNVLPFRKTS